MSLTISAVIPTLNEADYLGQLLDQLAGQSRPPDEVIVADAGSKDATIEVARAHGARIVPGGRPAAGRTSGGMAAMGDWLYFFDADTRLPDDFFIERSLADLLAQGVSAAVSDQRAYYRPGDKGYDRPLVRAWDRLIFGRAINWGQRSWLKWGFPVGQATWMASRRDIFRELGGFNSSAEPFEDSEYLLRVHRTVAPPAGRNSAVGVLSPEIFHYISMRRYDQRGRFFAFRMGFRSTFLRWLLGREMPWPEYFDLNQEGYTARPPTGETGWRPDDY
ncbi:MAG: glycosyltransferase [Deltaproteobacteria bacterium]|nr:glycosyltransferase [Deltaproteobacteria bacterium]